MNFSVLTSQFWSLCLQGVALGLIYSLIALGYTMVYGVLRLINFANSEVFMVGTFSVLFIQITVLGHAVNRDPMKGWPLVFALLLSLIAAMSSVHSWRRWLKSLLTDDCARKVQIV